MAKQNRECVLCVCVCVSPKMMYEAYTPKTNTTNGIVFVSICCSNFANFSNNNINNKPNKLKIKTKPKKKIINDLRLNQIN